MKTVTNQGFTRNSNNLKGIGFLVLALLIGSLQSVAVKWLAGRYPVLEMVVFRNLVALPFTLVFFRMEGRRGLPITKNPKAEVLRGLYYFSSYTTFMMGVLVLPLVQVESIRISGPIMITILSVFILGEKVKPIRWLALFVGLVGVIFITGPGSASFNEGSIFILISVLFYALAAISTREIQISDSSATMAFYSSLVYLAAALVFVPITLLVGELPNTHRSISFLFQNWSVPTALDALILCGMGLVWAGWSYTISLAYGYAEASAAAPFEYLSLPINAFWGFAFWAEIPTSATLFGAGLTLLSGMFILYLDRSEGKKKALS